MDEQLKVKKVTFTLVGTYVITEIVIFAKNEYYQITNKIIFFKKIYFLKDWWRLDRTFLAQKLHMI